MATDNIHRYGFRWVRSVSGKAAPDVVKVPIASAYAPTAGGTAVGLHVGDPIQIASTGYGTISVGSEGTQSKVFGIIHGFGPIYDGAVMQPRSFFPNAGGAYSTNYIYQSFMYVVPVEDQIFAVDCDDKTTFTTYATYLASFGENADMVLVADTSNAADPKADPKLDISTHNTTSTLQWRILDVNQKVYQDYGGSNVSLLVSCNVPQRTNTTGV